MVEALCLRIRVEELCDRRVEWALVEKLEPSGAPAEKSREAQPYPEKAFTFNSPCAKGTGVQLVKKALLQGVPSSATTE